jgi:hypothetical protein
MSVVEVVDEAGYRALLASERLAVLHFWADFAAECRTVTAVLAELGTGVGLGHYSRILSFLQNLRFLQTCVPDPDPSDPYIFGPPGSFYHQAKIVRKTLILLFCDLFLTFYLLKMM